MNTCIISGRFPITQFESPTNHKLYADIQGYSYIHCNWPTTSKNNYFNKIIYVLNYIEFYDYIVWIDDDAFYFNLDNDIMDYAPKGDSFISFCKSPSFKELKTLFNSGHFIVQCNSLSKQFFKDVLKTDLNRVKAWWKDELGFFSNGDQDAMVYLLLESEQYKNKMDLYDYQHFNSRYENLFTQDVHKPFVLHFTGRGPTKQANLKAVQSHFNLHPSLVENSVLKNYNIKIQDDYKVAKQKSSLKTKLLKVKDRLKK
ncbi:putative nucleotide-diphospho-sugar transferase [Winogradskyella sp.]|uniref:putative nucleotide-diphospho-sugar transferase n=1 Tax=Winogradskyella sp. TaxID=1883156 RepID=UPI001AFD976B|nr:putative nucleotide-diphospho-sugar transferase [Winogradskyella sp.]MBO6881596.1 hypothetical protein [Winogradskyella sp.]